MLSFFNAKLFQISFSHLPVRGINAITKRMSSNKWFKGDVFPWYFVAILTIRIRLYKTPNIVDTAAPSASSNSSLN